MDTLINKDVYVIQWDYYMKLNTRFRFLAPILLSLIPLTKAYLFFFHKGTIAFEKPTQTPILLSFTIVYMAIALRYLRLELVLRALKQDNKEKAAKMLISSYSFHGYDDSSHRCV